MAIVDMSYHEMHEHIFDMAQHPIYFGRQAILVKDSSDDDKTS
jgi:hypothetical protein